MKLTHYKGICIILAVFIFSLAACTDEDEIYGISLSHTEYTFDSFFTGYDPPDPLTLTVTNTGNQPTGTLELNGSVNLTSSTGGSLNSIAVGGTTTFTVSPKTGLSEGTYTSHVYVLGYYGKYNNNRFYTSSCAISFTVTIPPSAELAYYWVEQDQLVLSAASASLSRGTSQSVTIAPRGSGYSNQRWFVNGDEVTGLDNPQSYTFSSVGRPYGRYTIGLSLRKDDGAFYYAETVITVTN